MPASDRSRSRRQPVASSRLAGSPVGQIAPIAGSTGAHAGNPDRGHRGDPDGEGYWLLGSDDGVFTFGAAFYGAAA